MNSLDFIIGPLSWIYRPGKHGITFTIQNMPFVFAFQIFDCYEDFRVECSNFYIDSFMNAVNGGGGVFLIKPDHKTHTLTKNKTHHA